MLDVIIIGSGIMGVTTAKMLSKYKLDVLLVEKNSDLGEGASKSNSGVLYAGFHPRARSLKGISCVKGNEMYKEICRELAVPVSYIGSLMVSFSDSGDEKINEKLQKGIANGAKGLKIITGDEARNLEPKLSPEVRNALYSPSTAIVDVFKLVLHNARLAKENGVMFKLNTEVKGIEKSEGFFSIKTTNGDFKSRFVINTAGENSDKIESYFKPCEFDIKPRKGQYLIFEKETDEKTINHVIYQAQDKDEKGCFLSPTIDGNLIAGPTSEDARDYSDTKTTAQGLKKIEMVSKKIIPSLDMNKVITSFAGIRANIENVEKEKKDFVIRRTVEGMASALGIKNPGITSAPYLCQMLIQLLEEDGLTLERDLEAKDELTITKNFFDCDEKTRIELLKADADYSKVICSCERVTLGDIKRVLSEPFPPTSLDGIKKRLRVGMGRCQGGFCTPELVDILSSFWGVPRESILKASPKSNIIKGRVK